MKLFAIIVGKLMIAVLQLFGRSGSALPGLVLEKLYPKLITKQLDNLPFGVVVVTGTNGKTTTTRSLVYLLRQSGLRVVTNPTGSNFTRGVYATIAKYSRWTGGLPYDVAVLELDEAFSRKFADMRPPEFVLALNVMRDQLDRYGEIDTTAEMIKDTVAKATKSVVLNADDSRVAALAEHASSLVHFFAVAHDLKKDIPSEDELHSRAAPKKVKKRKNTSVTLVEYKNSHAVFGIEGKRFPVQLAVPGIHNAVNITAALAMAQQVNPQMKPQFMIPTLKDITSAFGRGETITVDGKELTLSLVKNPSGFRQAMHSFAHEPFDAALFVINDEYADGRDVSWLWDVDFKDIPKRQKLFTSGLRAFDMALRLEYDDHEVLSADQNIRTSVGELLTETSERAIVYCTYTAMLAIRKDLADGRGAMGDVW